MVRQERLSVILANISVRDKAGFATQITCELATKIVFDDDGVPRALQQIDDRVPMQGNQPAYGKMTGGNTRIPQELAGLVNHPVGRAPADQRNVCVSWAL